MIMLKPVQTIQYLIITTVLLGYFGFVEEVFAETAYISDDLAIELRSGPTQKHRITAFLKSGQPIDILEKHLAEDGTEWVRVASTGSSKQQKSGWLPNKFTQPNTSAKIKLQQVTQTLTQLQHEQKTSQTQTSQLKQNLTDFQARHQQMTQRLQSLKLQYDELKAISSNSEMLAEQNIKMQQQLALLSSDQEQLEMKNFQLQTNNKSKGMIHGIIAVLIGVLLALILPKIVYPRPKSSWD